MASSHKSKVCPLSAIYKLEFYKNKKNWKFEKRSPAQKPKTETKLNKTYVVGGSDLEPDCDEEHMSHNKGFLCEKTDDEPNPQPPKEPPESEPPECELPVLPAPQHLPYGQHSWPRQSAAGDKSADLCHQEWEWCGAEAEVVPEELVYDQCDGPQHDDNVWEPVSRYEQLNPDCGAPDPQEYLSSSATLSQAGNSLQQHGWPVLQNEYSPTYDLNGSLDDSADFMRGAHCAPHSSEIDFSVTPQDFPGYEELRLLPQPHLKDGNDGYRSMLADLLREIEIRDKLYSHSILLPPMGFEGSDTNTDPHQPPDYFVSGSHLLSGPHAVGIGRGRGRLQQANRVIGIRMGRPYRIVT